MPLVDVKFTPQDSTLAMIGAMISGGRETGKLAPGVYLRGNWNFDHEIGWRNEWIEGSWEQRLFEEYGVCDNWEQIAARHAERFASDTPYCIALVQLDKADEPPSGGWRWHKWGEYIGTQDPQCEYLAHEPVIERVYTYTVYELEARHVAESTP